VRQAADDCLQQVDRTIDTSIIAAILDLAASISDGRAVAMEDAPRVGEGQTAGHVCEIHGRLACECCLRRAAGTRPQIARLDVEHDGDGVLDDALERERRALTLGV